MDCKYEAITHIERCLKCGGKLEILASEIKKIGEEMKHPHNLKGRVS